MSSDHGRTPWWEFDPNEKPVPLDPLVGWHASDDAELIVNAEREALARQDTEPNAATMAFHAIAGSPANRGSIRVRSAVAACLLLVACGVMFVMGWSHGTRVAASSQTASEGWQLQSDAVMEATRTEVLSGQLEGRAGKRQMEDAER